MVEEESACRPPSGRRAAGCGRLLASWWLQPCSWFWEWSDSWVLEQSSLGLSRPVVVVGFGLFLGRIGLMGIRYRRLVARSRSLSESEDTPNGP
jgi:hypothetical protein